MEDYQPTGFAAEIFNSRYAIHENETWAEACDRVTNHVAMAEHGEERLKFQEETLDILKKNLFMPGGRIWYGSGRAKGQLLNCFVVPTDDSREGWGKTVSDMIVISGVGGGVGTNFSPIRPRGSSINGSGGTATGAVSLMEIMDSAGSVIKAGGGRRTALMFCLNLGHGDALEFLDKKLNLDELKNANVSIVFDDNPEIFFKLVKEKKDFYFYHRGKEIGKIPAAKLWKKIVANAVKSGEPGLLNGWYANRMSNLWYWKKLISTNPCGEIWMAAYECCCLGSLVLPRFLTSSGSMNWQLLKSTVKKAVRFLDNVLSVNNYPLPEITETCKSVRRVGLGVMGLHDVLLLNDLKYNSPEGLEFVDKMMKSIKNYAYEASVELAMEKGAFPLFDADKFLMSQFVKGLKPTIRRSIKENGIRNGALLTIAPTGTTSMVCEVTSALESMFAAAMERRYYDGEELKMEIVIHPLLKRFLDEGRDVSHFQGAHEISLRDHLEMQRTCQKHVDNAVSKTINIPQGTSIKELSDLYMEYLPELKGVTVYPDGSREDQPLTPIPLEKAIKHAQTASQEARASDSCKSGVCDI
ncbi:MAG: ribonucleotide reductase N-terminal alpha domain-containing protein [Candidatus Thorarchaeota archaeon]|jgi:ribonucleoside-diphosphate reductase alpha chain